MLIKEKPVDQVNMYTTNTSYCMHISSDTVNREET